VINLKMDVGSINLIFFSSSAMYGFMEAW